MRGFGTVAVLVALGCSSETDFIDNTLGDARVTHKESWLAEPGREIWLFVGDDADTAAAVDLRQRVAAAYRPRG